MKFVFNNNLQSVLLVSLVLLANAQRSSNFKDIDIQELARQNKITKQILEAYINKKLGVRNTFIRPPSIHDILPKNMKTRQKTEMSEAEAPEAGDGPEGLEGQEQEGQDQEGQEISEDDSLQSVESEQIDSVYDNAGKKKYPIPPFEPDLEPTHWNRKDLTGS